MENHRKNRDFVGKHGSLETQLREERHDTYGELLQATGIENANLEAEASLLCSRRKEASVDELGTRNTDMMLKSAHRAVI